MTTQTAIIITQDYGSSLSTPTLRNYLTDSSIVAADSANEVTANSGRYALVFDETSVHAAGWYGLRGFVSGAPINRFVYLTGVDGETAIAVTDLPPGVPQTGQVIVTRPVGDDTPITFSFPVASATLSGTRRINNAGSTTALSGARSFLRTSGTQHLYSLAYNAADRPSDDGIVEYVFTDGAYSRTVVLKAVSAVLDPAVGTQITAIETFATRMTTGIVQDGLVWQFTANMLELGPSSSGGDATLAKQVEILTAIQGSTVIQVASPNVSGNLVLTQGDDYDGTANPKASWTVSTDYTDGWSVTLTIRDADDEVVYTTAGEVVSSTVVAVTIAAPTGLTMTGCPGQWQGKFDVQMTKAGKKKTIALGVCYINEDQTR